MKIIALLLGALIALGIAAHGQDKPETPKLPDDVVMLRNLPYGTGGGRPLTMHLLKPKKPLRQYAPVIVFIHGGAWYEGGKDDGLSHLTRFVQRGYIGATIDYRLTGEAIFPAQIEDCKCAIRYLRAHSVEYGLDPDHIGVWGESAGGHLAALLGVSLNDKSLEGKGGLEKYSSRVQAVVDCYGPTDLLKIGRYPSEIKHDAADSAESRLIGGPIQENKDKAIKASPITYVGKDSPPFLILHGDKDPIVPLNQSELLASALKKAKIEVTFYVVKGGGHGFGGPEIDAMIASFFDKHLIKEKVERPQTSEPKL